MEAKFKIQGFPGGSVVRIRLPVQETWVQSLIQEDPLFVFQK